MKIQQGTTKMNVILAVIVLLVLGGAIIYSYTLFNKNQELKSDVVKNQEIITKYNENVTIINEEIARCEVLISSGTSVFGDFAYCERFLNWVQGLK